MALTTPSIIQVTINPNLKFASGSITGAVNIGDGDGILFPATSGSLIQLKTIKAGAGITVTNNSNDVTITSSGSAAIWGLITGSITSQTDLYNELTTLSGSIVDRELLSNKSTDTNLGTSNILYPTQNAVKEYVDNNIQASSSVTTATNLGSGEEVFAQKVGNDLQFKSLVAGTNIIISSSSTEITISSTASGSSSSGSLWGLISGNIEDQTDLYNELTLLSGSIQDRELLLNKSTNVSLGTSNILYPTQNAVKTYVDTNISASSSVTTASNVGLRGTRMGFGG